MAGFCKRGNEPSGSIVCREFLDYPRTGKLLKKDCVPWSKLRQEGLMVMKVNRDGCVESTQ